MRVGKSAFEAFLAMGRDGSGGWRFFLAFLLLAALFIMAPILVGLSGLGLFALFGGWEESLALFNNSAQDLGAMPYEFTVAFLIAMLISLAVVIPGLAVIMDTLHNRSIATVLGARHKLVGRNLLCGAFAAVASGLLTLSAAASIGLIELTPNEHPPSWPLAAAVIAVLIVFQASAEELVFRGYFLQWIGARTRNIVAWAVLPSALFALLHFSGETGPDAMAYVLATFIFGLFASALVWLTGGLSCAIGYHIANNWVALLLVNAPVGIQGLGLYQIDVSPERLPMLMGLGLLFLPAIYAGLAAATVAETPAQAPVGGGAEPELRPHP